MDIVFINAINLSIIFLSSVSIFFCYYLHRLTDKSQSLIPIIKSRDELVKRQGIGPRSIQPKKCTIEENGLDKYGNKEKNKYKANGHWYSNKSKDGPGLHAEIDKEINLPFVSIIVPARNEEEHIERCIHSLLKQIYPKFEIIVIDDNSIDNTLTILENIQSNLLKKNRSSTTFVNNNQLKILSLKEKPKNWTGKTWASQKGFYESKGEILLFTDADTYYSKNDVLFQTITYMLRENLDVLTGIPMAEKRGNIWSKIATPMWNFTSILFSVGSVSEVNNPKSKIAFLMGCFFLIKRDILIKIGTFEAVCEIMQEDKALGVIIKQRGYKMRLVKLIDMVYTLWADDLVSLWHGIGRTMAPLVIKNKLKIILNLLVIFFACVTPFILLPLTILFDFSSFLGSYNTSIVIQNSNIIPGIIACVCLSIFSSAKGKKGKIPKKYSMLGAPFGSIFVFIAYLHSIIPILLNGSAKPIMWQGRNYFYDKKQEGFAI